MPVQPYLFFDGRCEEALEFYKKVLGAQVTMLLRFKDSPEPDTSKMPKGSENKVMHAEFKVQDSTLLASDGYCMGAPKFQGFALSVSVPDAAQAARLFDALGQGGKVDMPLAKTFFSESFGMVTDQFGIGWMVGVFTE